MYVNLYIVLSINLFVMKWICTLSEKDGLKTFNQLYITSRFEIVNSSPPGQNDCHFADDIFKSIFMDEKSCILIRIFSYKSPIDKKLTLV